MYVGVSKGWLCMLSANNACFCPSWGEMSSDEISTSLHTFWLIRLQFTDNPEWGVSLTRHGPNSDEILDSDQTETRTGQRMVSVVPPFLSTRTGQRPNLFLVSVVPLIICLCSTRQQPMLTASRTEVNTGQSPICVSGNSSSQLNWNAVHRHSCWLILACAIDIDVYLKCRIHH